jgi:hypothetical protein
MDQRDGSLLIGEIMYRSLLVFGVVQRLILALAVNLVLWCAVWWVA